MLLFAGFDHELEHFDGGFGDFGSGTEDGEGACFVEVVVVLGGDDASDDDHDVGAAEFVQFEDDLWD